MRMRTIVVFENRLDDSASFFCIFSVYVDVSRSLSASMGGGVSPARDGRFL